MTQIGSSEAVEDVGGGSDVRGRRDGEVGDLARLEEVGTTTEEVGGVERMVGELQIKLFWCRVVEGVSKDSRRAPNPVF